MRRRLALAVLLAASGGAALLVRPLAAADGYASVDFTPGGWGVLFSEVFRSLDVIGFALTTLTVVLFGMAVDLFNHLRVGKLVPEGLLAEVQEEMANGEYEKALELCDKSNCLIGQVFAAALAKTDYSFERMEEAMRGELDIQGMVWRQWIGQFRILTVLGPLLGAGGALVNALRFVSDLTGRPNVGLALASSFEMRAILYNILIALFMGVAMSALALAVHTLAASKLEKILLEARRLGEELLDPFRPLPIPEEE